MNTTYQVFVQGGMVDEVGTLKTANKLRDKYEAEGWDVYVLKVSRTILGHIGVLV